MVFLTASREAAASTGVHDEPGRSVDEAPQERCLESAPLKSDVGVLIVRVGAMGDVLHGLPAVTALREALPGCRIGWAVEPAWASLLEADVVAAGLGRPVVDRVHRVGTKSWKESPLGARTRTEILALRREMRAERYDVCVDLQGSIRSAVIGRMAGAGRLVGPARPREAPARKLYGSRVLTMEESVLEQACELVGAAVGLELRQAAPRVAVDERAEAWAEERLRELGVGGRFVLLTTGAGWGAKEWTAEGYAELTRRLKAEGVTVLANDTGSERIPAGAGAVKSSVAELTALTRRAAVVVGGDTGPVHLAAAVGRPVVALYGPTDPRRNGPHFVGARVRVLRHAESVTDHGRYTETEAGLRKIGVDAVADAVFEMLKVEDGTGAHG